MRRNLHLGLLVARQTQENGDRLFAFLESMTELAINASAETLVFGGFIIGFTLAMIGAGVRMLLGIFGEGDSGA